MIEYYDPEYIHIASDGSLGKAARSWCLNNKKPFTTTYLGNPQQPVNAKAKRFH